MPLTHALHRSASASSIRAGSPATVATLLLALALAAAANCAAARESGDPIQLAWTEGDLAGVTSILSPEGQQIGFVEYHQRLRGDRLEAVRVARFADGSSDEDQVEARVGKTLEAVRGRSIIRDQRGTPTVDIRIDVAKGTITGFSGIGKDREEYDEKAELPKGTYWGPLIFIVVKNFQPNSSDGKLVFRTVAATPKPRVIDMELTRDGEAVVTRPGGKLDVVRLTMKPTINWLIDPIIQRIAPQTTFFVAAGKPPLLARYAGPRNYAGQEIRLE